MSELPSALGHHFAQPLRKNVGLESMYKEISLFITQLCPEHEMFGEWVASAAAMSCHMLTCQGANFNSH